MRVLFLLVLLSSNVFAEIDYKQMFRDFVLSDPDLAPHYKTKRLSLNEHLISKNGGRGSILWGLTFRSTEFSSDSFFYWSPFDDKGNLLKKSNGRILHFDFTKNIKIDGVEWWGWGAAPRRSSVYVQDVTPEKIIVKSGFLAEETTINGKKYSKYAFVCFNEKREVIYSMELDFSGHSNLGFSECHIEILSSNKPVTLESETFLPETDILFDKKGKWHFVRMLPGQEFQGKVYKDGGVLLRGDYNKYQKNHGPEDIRILTPDMEGYPH